MKKFYCLNILLLGFAISAIAQNKGNVRGTLMDTASKHPVSDATITILQAKDSSLVTFSRSNSTGIFNVDYLDKGNYRMLVTHVGYRNLSKFFEITDNNKSVDLGYIAMNNKSVMLDEVTVSQEKAPVTLRNDTVEYNAGSFKTKPNSVVEDLLKKLPGIQVDKDGKIKAQGEEVKKVLVDGKQFFGNDPKVATKNLPADIVDKVQVFDKKSDQSQFTGFDDGNSEKTINLSLKQDKKNGMFGRATAAAGNKGRYQGNFNVNQFDGERQISAIGMANNTNKQGFSFMDILNFTGGLNGPGGGRGGGQIELATGGLPISGMNGGNNTIQTTWAGGLNFNETYNKKVEINGSYFYNRIEDRIEQKTNRQYILPGNNFNREQNSLTNRKNENHRFNFSSDYKIDSMNSLKFSTTANIQQSSSRSSSNYVSSNNNGELLNQGFTNTASKSDGYGWNNNLLYRHKFAKKGRTFSANLSFNLNNGESEGTQRSITDFYKTDGSLLFADSLDQLNNQDNKTTSYGGVFSYTEPLSRKALLEFNYNYNKSESRSGRETFDFDSNTGKHSEKNELFSNRFENIYQFNRGGMTFRYQDKTMNFTIGGALQQASLNTDFHFMAKDSSLSKSFTNFLPNAGLQYNINRYKGLRFLYNTFSRQPAASQLNPIMDISDPLNIRVGNPDLSQEYNHRVQLNYNAFDPFRRTNLFIMASYTGTNNRIVNNDLVSAQGIRTTSYTNVDGAYSANAYMNWGFPVKPIKSSLNLNTNIDKSRNINFVNGAKNIINTWNIGEELNLNFIHKEALDLSLGTRVSYNGVKYSLTGQQNTNYWNQEVSLDANIYFPHGFSLASEYTFTRNTGYSNGFNTNVSLWNAGIAKQMFKNKKGEIRVQMFDILNQNVGISRNANQNYIEDVQTKILNRFFLVGFTYNISRFAGKGAPMQGGANIKVIGERQRM
ncbi:MAG TPA: outer membrane beta-barrel protein [Chitinophagaceae bacterium]|nr:outer membrane beta-barrel protein [Chitinophagaceae bacterium]